LHGVSRSYNEYGQLIKEFIYVNGIKVEKILN